jgi:hypothetical protein
MGRIHRLLVVFFLVTPGTAQWSRVELLDAGESYAVIVVNDTVYAAIDNVVFFSDDQWASYMNFTPLNDSGNPITTMLKLPSSFVVGTLDQGVYETFDRQLWTQRNEGLAGLGAHSISALVLRDSFLFAGTYGAGVFRAPASFATPWSGYSEGIPSNIAWNINSLTNLDGTLWAGGGSNAMAYRNGTTGTSWQEIAFAAFSPLGTTFLAATMAGPTMHAIGSQGFHRSTDGGTTWTEFDPGAGYISTGGFAHTPLGLYAFLGKPVATHLFRLNEDDSSWSQVNVDPGQTFAVAAVGNLLYGSRLDGLWKYDLSPSSAGEMPPGSPATFLLEPNYPNPFNPTTRIGYEVPPVSSPSLSAGNRNEGWVRLAVYDLLGQEVAVLVDEPQQAGRHQVTFDGGNLPGGTYVYQLTLGSRAESRRMVLLK